MEEAEEQIRGQRRAGELLVRRRCMGMSCEQEVRILEEDHDQEDHRRALEERPYRAAVGQSQLEELRMLEW